VWNVLSVNTRTSKLFHLGEFRNISRDALLSAGVKTEERENQGRKVHVGNSNNSKCSKFFFALVRYSALFSYAEFLYNKLRTEGYSSVHFPVFVKDYK
jgi:hypothetical protein